MLKFRRAAIAGLLSALALALAGSAGGAPRTSLAAARTVYVPILMYHFIRVNPVPGDRVGFNLSVTPSDFTAQMDTLYRRGFHTITFDQLFAGINGAPLPSNPVILTFDDGFESFASQAVPIMKSYGFVGIDYVVPGFIDRPGYMSHAQLSQVVAAGMIIGAHTMDHVCLPRMSYSVARAEIVESRQILQQWTGQPVLDFAYPYGCSSPRDANLVAQAGFREAVVTDGSSLHPFTRRYTWGRLRVSGGENIATYASRLNTTPPPGPIPPAPCPQQSQAGWNRVAIAYCGGPALARSANSGPRPVQAPAAPASPPPTQSSVQASGSAGGWSRVAPSANGSTSAAHRPL